MKRGISIVALLLTLCCAVFAEGKPSGSCGNLHVTPQQIRQHSMAANKQRTWEANRTNRQLYRKEQLKKGNLKPLDLIPRRIRRPSHAWYYSLFKIEKSAYSIDKIVLGFLERETNNFDLTKPLPEGIKYNFDSVIPIINIDYLQVETIPAGDIWQLSDVWYKAEDPDVIEIVDLEGNEKGVLFKKPGAVRLRAFALEKRKIYSWKAFVNVEPDGSSASPNNLIASENTTNMPVAGETKK